MYTKPECLEPIGGGAQTYACHYPGRPEWEMQTVDSGVIPALSRVLPGGLNNELIYGLEDCRIGPIWV